MKTVEVDYSELVKHITEHCSKYFYNYQEGECCRGKVDKETCSLHVFSDELRCPSDCPRLNTKDYGCDKGRCSYVKAVINKLIVKKTWRIKTQVRSTSRSQSR